MMIYPPAEDSHLLATALARIARNSSVLDMGAGSGILSETALRAGARSVCAADIDPDVIALLSLKRIPALRSNLFENVSGRFDIIVCNPPYLPEDSREDPESRRALAGGKRGDEFTLRFLKQALKHLEPQGCILLLLSSLAPKERILRLLARQGMRHEVVARQKLFMEQLEVWRI